MNSKKILSSLLCASMLCAGGTLSAFALEPTIASNDVVPVDSIIDCQTPAYSICAEVTIASVNMNDTSSSITVLTAENEDSQLVLNISEETIIIDGQTGLAVAETDLKQGDKIHAYHNGMMTRSLPAQTHAQAIVVNLGETAIPSPARFLTAEQVTVDIDGNVKVVVDNGSSIITIAPDTAISPLETKDMVRNTDIHMGTQFFAWYDIVTLSMPAQANATKVVIAPNVDRAFTIKDDESTVIGEGQVKNGIAMVPLRVTAEALGFTLTWDESTESIQLSNGTVRTSVTLGTDSYYMAADGGLIGMSKPSPLGAAPYEENGISCVPAQLFSLLLQDFDMKLVGNTLFL